MQLEAWLINLVVDIHVAEASLLLLFKLASSGISACHSSVQPRCTPTVLKVNKQKGKGNSRGKSILSKPGILQINDGGKGSLHCEHPYMGQLIKWRQLAVQASVTNFYL